MTLTIRHPKTPTITNAGFPLLDLQSRVGEDLRAPNNIAMTTLDPWQNPLGGLTYRVESTPPMDTSRLPYTAPLLPTLSRVFLQAKLLLAVRRVSMPPIPRSILHRPPDLRRRFTNHRIRAQTMRIGGRKKWKRLSRTLTTGGTD